MKNILFVILSILSLSVFGQVQDTALLAGKAQFSQSGAGSGYWQVSGTFTDESGLNDAGGILAGDVLFFSDAGIGYFLPITQVVSATPPSFTIRVSNVGITNIVSVPTTSGVIYRPSTGEYLTFTAGISNPDQQTFQSRLAKKLDELSGGDGNGIISALPLGDVVIAGAASSDLRIQNTRVQLDGKFKVGADSSFVHDPVQDTSFTHGYSKFGKQPSDDEFYDFTFRTHDGGSTAFLIESGRAPAVDGTAELTLRQSGRNNATISYGNTTTGKGLAFYNVNAGKYVMYMGSSGYVAGNSRTVIVGNVDDPTQWGGNGTFVIFDTITSGKALLLAKKASSSATPIATFASGANDRLIIEDDGDIEVNKSYFLPKTAPSATANVVNIMKWTAGVPSFGPITNDYEVTITGGNTDSKLYIRADVSGVTASYSSNQLTITIPGNGKIHSADWRMVSADVQASADGGGVTNWTAVRFVNTSHNTSIADMRCPDVTKIAIPSSGALSVSNSATYDTDNNPAVSVIDVGGNAITVRVGGLSIGSQGFILKFTQI